MDPTVHEQPPELKLSQQGALAKAFTTDTSRTTAQGAVMIKVDNN